jgi:hypothetical protein
MPVLALAAVEANRLHVAGMCRWYGASTDTSSYSHRLLIVYIPLSSHLRLALHVHADFDGGTCNPISGLT